MSFPDVLLLIIRWVHALAAVSWVGGGAFYLLVLRPNIRDAQGDMASAIARVGQQFRHLVNTAIAVLLVTGVILTLSRVTSNYVGAPYIAVLVVKIVLALYMFYLVRFLRPRTYPGDATTPARGIRRATSLLTGATAVLVIGVIVFLLADILRALVERGIEG
jgi:uncharacterized membrane protein